jgi:hypothetical protein
MPLTILTNGFEFESSHDRIVSRPVSRVLSWRFPAMYGHSSGALIAECFAQPTRAACRKKPWAEAHATPIRSCSRWGLPGRNCCQPRGALLPHLFTLARCLRIKRFVSVALSLGSPPPGVTRHRISVEPGLSSLAPFRALQERPSSRLTGSPMPPRPPGQQKPIDIWQSFTICNADWLSTGELP